MSGKGNALGFIETVGLAAAVAAADAACKAANVSLIGREISKGYGYVTVKISGEVGAVKAGLAAAKAASERVNRVWSMDLIPRPAAGLGDVLVWNRETRGADRWREERAGEEAPQEPAPEPEVPEVPAEEPPSVPEPEGPAPEEPQDETPVPESPGEPREEPEGTEPEESPEEPEEPEGVEPEAPAPEPGGVRAPRRRGKRR